MTSIRIPARVLFYMDATGWGQGSENVDRDPVRRRLLEVIAGPKNADGSATVKDPSAALLARLYFEADHMTDFVRYGDVNADTLADSNSGSALIRRVRAIDPGLTQLRARELMYGETTP